MKKVFKKAISVLLVAVMIFGAAPLSGFVGLELPEIGMLEKISDSVADFLNGLIPKAKAISYEGKCGDNLIYSYDKSTYTLTIIGYGDMYDYEILEEGGVWEFDPCYVVLPEGITSIGKAAFSYCERLQEIFIPDSVKKIDSEAFFQCQSLYAVNSSNIGEMNTPLGVKNIGDKAFVGCLSLSEINLSEGLKSVGNFAFAECLGVTVLNISKSVEIIGAFAFHDCNIESVTIPDGIKSIGIAAFSCMDRLKEINYNAIDCAITPYSGYYWCHSYNSAYLPTNSALHDLENGKGIFRHETGMKVNTISLINIGSKTQKIPDGLFYRCDDIDSIKIPNSVTSIGDYAFAGCGSLTDVYFESSEHEWNTISIGISNDVITNATIHFKCTQGGEETPPLEEPKVGFPIKVMSYNIYSYNAKGYRYQGYYDNNDYTYSERTKYIINNIIDNSPDSVGFQEITEEFRISVSTSQDITGRALDNYAWANKEYRNDGTTGEKNEGCLVLYNAEKYDLLEEDTFWLNENGEKYKKADEWNAEYTRICSYAVLKDKKTGFIYAHFNTHLDHNSFAAINSIDKIIDFIDKNFADIPVVLTGDFNHKNDTDVYKAVIHNGFADANTAGDTTLTYHEYNRGEYNPKIIDYIFVNKYFSSSKYEVYDKNYSSSGLEIKYASDHHPIIAELTPVDLTDTDGDGLPDNWEINGVDVNNDGVIDINLKEMGADPYKPDIFVEVDWMKGYKPSSNALKMVYEAFRDSPNGGINLHIDAGSDSIDFVTGKSWDEYSIESDGEEVEYKENITIGNDAEERTDWYNIVEPNFSMERRGVFRHCLYIRQYNNSTSTGKASGIVGQYYVVSKGQFSTDIWEAGTFMHELGHTLGLRHGGCDDLNYKANYLSVMNYLYQGGLLYSGKDNYMLDYSRYELPSYNEASLTEKNGVDPNGMTADTGLGIILRKGSNRLTPIYNVAYKAIDFNLDGDTDDVNLAIDLNGDGLKKDDNGTYYVEYDVHKSHNDWDNLIYSGGTIGGNGASLSEVNVYSSSDIIEEINSEEMDIIISAFVKINIPNPSTTTINYGDKIILHADIEGELPAGYEIKWISSNNNFSMAVSDNGKTCTISPESSGETVFTAVIVDENENTVSSDEQTMTAKAGFFQKIIAFFKKLFGLTKTIPQLKK